MKRAWRILILGLAACAAGCASPQAYFLDRGRDAADILTASVGYGAGVQVRAAVVQTGLFYNHDVAGLRGGDFFGGIPASQVTEWSALLPIVPVEHQGVFAGSYSWQNTGTGLRRSKTFDARQDIPFLCPMAADGSAWGNGQAYQIEAAAGLGLTLRVGFNPAELLDFLFGWIGLDLLGDDVGVIRRR